MKFGVLSHKPLFDYISSGWKHNIGDIMQSIAIEQLYNSYGIENYIFVNKYELATYNDAHYVVVPITNSFNLSHKCSFPFSSKIIPVIIGTCIAGAEIYDPNVTSHLSKCQPIGCRDRRSLDKVRSNGLQAFLSGCITVTLPKRKHNPTKGKVYFVDTPESLIQYVPKELLKNSKFLSHMIPTKKVPIDDEEAKRIYEFTENRLNEYKNNADLIVTSRLHCAAPCMAMGIPVILANENFGTNVHWIDRFLPVYQKNDFSKIDWHPQAVEYEEAKSRIKEVFINQINHVYEKNQQIYDLSEFYEEKEDTSYRNDILSRLQKLHSKIGDSINCAIWPHSTLASNDLIDDIRTVFEKCSFIIIDDFIEYDEFGGFKIHRSNEIDTLPSDTIFFIISTFVKDIAKEFLKDKMVFEL